jgi:hypothetical protein
VIDRDIILIIFDLFKIRKLMQAYRAEMQSRREKWCENKSGEPRKQEKESGTLNVNFSLVAGTELFDEQLKLIKPQVHIFGS